jgi:hypothetical protein
VVQQIGANDPIELRVGMMGGNALVEAVAVVRIVLLGRGLTVELGDATRHSAAQFRMAGR